MSSFQALTLCHAVFVVSWFLFFGLLWEAKEAVSEVAWDAIPHARIPLSGHYRARMVRLYAFYVPCVVGYIAVAAGAGIVELEIAKLAPGEGIAILANLFAFLMFLAAASSIPMGIVAFLSLVRTIKENERIG